MRIIMLMILLSFSCGLAAAEELYVKSTKGKIHSAPGFKNSVVVVLSKGDKVEVLEQKQDWIKVKAGDHTGWISKLLVSKNPPLKRISVIKGKETKTQKESVRRRASSASTAAAARGLREDGRARLSDSEQANYEALEKMEKEGVAEDEVEKFSEGLAE